MQKAIEKVNVLMEALPYIRRFRGKMVVIKYGGSVIANEERKRDIVQDIVFMSFVGIRPYLVHGGGPAISEAMKAAGKSPRFINGLRVTDEETLDIVGKVLTEINGELVHLIEEAGGDALGYDGRQRGFLRAKKLSDDLGCVGEVAEFDGRLPVVRPDESAAVPVIAPMGCGEDGKILNMNADDVAAEIASGEPAEKLVLVTDVPGIMTKQEEKQSLISTLKIERLEEMITSGVISGGMIPKVRACVRALRSGVKKAHIVDGNISHALLLEIFTDKGIGTEIYLTRR